MLNDIAFFRCDVQVDAAVADCLQIFGENVPYIVERRLGGKTYIFLDHFIQTAREAMTTGCLAKMNDQELLLFDRFIQYENGSSYRDITRSDDEAAVALDQWFMDDIKGNAHPVINSCYNEATQTWETMAEWKDL